MSGYGEGYGDSFSNEGSWRPSTRRGMNSAHFSGKEAGSRDYNRYYGKQSRNFKGIGPKGYTRPDESILEEVCDILTRDNSINATEIEVRVKDGAVRLSGSVNLRKEKWAAEMQIEHIPGVRDILNDIKVSRWGSFPESDYQNHYKDGLN